MSIKKYQDFIKEHISIEENSGGMYDEIEIDSKDGYVFTITTKEGIERAEKSGDVRSMSRIGYHFKADTKAELDGFKDKYKKGDKYNGETIIGVSTKNGDIDFEYF